MDTGRSIDFIIARPGWIPEEASSAPVKGKKNWGRANYITNFLDPFGGAKPHILKRVKKRRSGSTLSPRPELGSKASPGLRAGESKG